MSKTAESSPRTNFSLAWVDFKMSDDYRRLVTALSKAGIKQPYLDNVIWISFTAGWNASKVKITVV